MEDGLEDLEETLDESSEVVDLGNFALCVCCRCCSSSSSCLEEGKSGRDGAADNGIAAGSCRTSAPEER